MTRVSESNVLSRLLHPADKKEETRRSNIREWLHHIGIKDVRVEYTIGYGRADIYLPNKRVIIEVKDGDKLRNGPNTPGTGSKYEETAFEQLSRYLEEERKNEQRYLDDDDENTDQPWVGIITDSQTWYIWEWNYTPKAVAGWDGTRLRKGNIGWLSNFILNRKQVGKEWVRPENLSEIFEGPLKDLHDMYQNERGSPDVETQRALWFRQLEISGNAPQTEDDKDELFVLHSMLIAISVHISTIYSKTDRRFGFASWIKGTQWSKNLVEKIQQYNWRQPRGDILRSLYMEMVDKEYRHLYGEYYTPDWLAEKLCEEVIDDGYIREHIEAYFNGKYGGCVTDPSCGSGTFLYHAAKRIMESEIVKAATMTDAQITDMLVKTLVGIDIHPVAVEMTKANLIRVLPHKPQSPLRVYQGDSLQVDRDIKKDQSLIEAENNLFVIRSRGGKKICFPLEFIMYESFATDVERFSTAASRSESFPPGLGNNLSREKKDVLLEAFQTLTDVCHTEGNDIWAWYTINRVGVYKLGGTASRLISNPPWVRASFIQNRTRKTEVEKLAKALGVWAGGKNATSINLGAVFVIQCVKLYGMNNAVSGWVLPWSAIKSNNWQAYRNRAQADVVWDLGRLPFPKHSEACVNIFGVEKKVPHKMKLNKDAEPPRQHDSWSTVEAKTTFVRITKRKKMASAWFKGTRAMARQGATITPLCLLELLDGYNIKDGSVRGVTVRSTQGNWKGRGSYDVVVPEMWLHEILTGNNLLPYTWGEPRRVVIPIDSDGNFLDGADENEYWKKALGLYNTHRGSGSNTPKTLDAQLDFNGKLSNQFPISEGTTVICNGSGSSLRAARLKKKRLIDHTLYRISTKSINEALFLAAILNADCMQARYYDTKPSKFHINTNFWFEIPIPRFDKNNPDHVELAKLSKRAESVATSAIKMTKNGIRDALREDGVSRDIDLTVARVMKAAKSNL